MKYGDILVNAESANDGKLVEFDAGGKLISSGKSITDFYLASDATEMSQVVRVSTNAGTSLGTTGSYVWTFEDEDSDPKGLWSSSTTFTPTVSGLYLFNGAIQLDNGASSVGFTDLRLKIGASTYRSWMTWEIIFVDSAEPIAGFIGVFYCTASTGYSIYVDIAATATCTQKASNTNNFLHITRVG